MTITKEQEEIISLDLKVGESLCVEAGAGTGKTTCFVEYCLARPDKTFLYLCFNNKAAKEAQEKYASRAITNTRTSTIHGLASSFKSKYERANKFRPKLSIKDIEKRFGYPPKLSWLVLETIRNFCFSANQSISTSNLPDIIDEKSKSASIILNESKKVWNSMVSLKDPCPISYDHYLKVYTLTKPKLNYDYILLDEAQDSNPLTISLLEDQRAQTRTILIGDQNQAIYGWRGAKNAMESWDSSHKLKLTESFRFGEKIAKIANKILSSYPQISHHNPRISGSKKVDNIVKTQSSLQSNTTYISRTNATLFEKAIDLQDKGLKCHFIGTEEATGWDPTVPYKLDDLKDIYWLWAGNKKKIQSPYLKTFQDYHEIRKIAIVEAEKRPQEIRWNQGFKKTQGDKELEFLCKMVEKYQHRLPEIIQAIKSQASGPSKNLDDKIVTLSTAHRAKGLEWNRVEIADDFISIKKLSNESKTSTQSDVEEINLLYVACTRAKNELILNQDLSQVCLQETITLPNIERLHKNNKIPTTDPNLYLTM